MGWKSAAVWGLCLALLCAGVGASDSSANWIKVPEAATAQVIQVEEGTVEAGESLRVTVSVPEAGMYHLFLAYQPLKTSTLSNLVLAEVAGEEVRGRLPLLWEDIPGDVRFDRYGNEIPPGQQLAASDAATYLERYGDHSGAPYAFSLPSGDHVLTLTPEVFGVRFTKVALVPAVTIQPYSSYAEAHSHLPFGTDFIVIEGERYALKNDSFIRGTSVRNAAVEPHDPLVRRINALAHTSFKSVGQKVLYEFEVKNSGRYALAFDYSQPMKAGMPVFRTIEVDGEVVFSELQDVAFPHTGMNAYANLVAGGAEPYYVYLNEGRHTLALKVTAAPIDHLFQRLTEMIGEMNGVTLQIKKLTGRSGDATINVDKNRTWDVLQYLPTILHDISQWQSELLAMYDELRAISGGEPTFANDLLLAAQNLERLKADPRTLPNKITLLGDDASSAAQLLGTLLPTLEDQALSIDRIYIYDGLTELPSATGSLWSRLSTALKEFLYSFSPIMNESGHANTPGRLTVWVNKPAQYVEVLQELCAQDFTARTGIDVAFSIMPKEDKLILANASGTNPDVVVGLSAHYPFDFGVRGLAKNLLEYDDFLQWYGEEYNLESLVPFSFDGGVYAAADTYEFRVLFYRKDILEMLGLEVPQTWDDVRAMMPTLHRNAMNFSIPLSTDREGYKGFQQTTPFVYQNGGDIYASDGMSAALTDPRTTAGLKQMLDLYVVYGLQTNVRSFFNSFRSGVIPLGVSDYATYLQLLTTAPELADLWDIALAPGVMNDEGEILRYQAAVDSATMILANTNMPDEAYAFLKWWLSEETQVNYGNYLQLKYGPDYKWNTANLAAFAQMGLPEKHKEVILTMWKDWQKETPRHVASYMLEREISNLWGYVIRDNKQFMPALDEAQKNSDREMQRKLREFGFIDETGAVIRPYQIGTAAQFEALRAAKEDEE
jgi:ABC-type glycerol-3-phosphate transport system substrate-binding protein